MTDPSPSKVLDQMEIDTTSTAVDSTLSIDSTPTNATAVAAAAVHQSRTPFDKLLAGWQAKRDEDYHYNVIPIPDLLRHLRERGIQVSFRDAMVAMLLVDDENRALASQNFHFTHGTANCFVAEHSNLVYEEEYAESEVGDASPGRQAQVDDDQSGNEQVDKADMMEVEQSELSSDHATQHQASEEL
ncbi:uncharacterized protein EAF01_002578 [Botrytis porri]|uniref:Uncharacterized protein n=1 Tax=Botrytis porri TaxID=87229 RepID=A0A4Z1KLW0_9HELO|nr:uncharacterized protein EAF01_002578 [Botrytis porri]KAF7911070.1 hypothetical protein EAF01_002578 [Botrytis porri]TGO86568.1 hypothetical protein BPOR_0293g00150 [Botrytis porri]